MCLFDLGILMFYSCYGSYTIYLCDPALSTICVHYIICTLACDSWFIMIDVKIFHKISNIIFILLSNIYYLTHSQAKSSIS